jgi:hypothetical protein
LPKQQAGKEQGCGMKTEEPKGWGKATCGFCMWTYTSQYKTAEKVTVMYTSIRDNEASWATA